ncbi:MAG: type II secretion system protein [Candidatus Pacebacteria bacterium]|nr:type II secretion system protein [Candidatus Paceibacterota bacterium]
MIFFLKQFKASQLKPKSYKLNAGMTYVEFIVVLGIFATLSSVVIFNYSIFQDKIDIKNFSSDIALKIIEAQKSALAGKLPLRSYLPDWKPSYGVFIDTQVDNQSLIYFTDLDQQGDYTHSSNSTDGCLVGNPECLEQIFLNKGNTISRLEVHYKDDSIGVLNDLTISFKRPNSAANINSTGISLESTPNISFVQITISSPRLETETALIKVYPFGKIEIK